MKVFRAKKIHATIETLVFSSIILTCIFLVLRTSIGQESISKEGTCAYQNKRGFIGVLYDDPKSDFNVFAQGNDDFLRRLFEHFLRPRAPPNFVFSPTSIALNLAVLAIGSEVATDGVLQEITYSAAFPCNIDHLKQDLITLKSNFSQYYKTEVFIDIFFDDKVFKNLTQLDWSIARYADKFTIAMKQKMNENLMHTYMKMDTSFGTSKFAISTFFDLKHDNFNRNSRGSLAKEASDFFVINCITLTIFRIADLHSR